MENGFGKDYARAGNSGKVMRGNKRYMILNSER